VADFTPDVVHAHWWVPSGRLVSGLGFPYVVTCHGSDVRLLDQWPAFRSACGRVLRRAAAVTAVSRFLANELAAFTGFPAGEVRVVPMPLDVEWLARGLEVRKANPARILYVGNLVPDKGVDILLGAFAVLRQRNLGCRLRVIGDGPSRASLIQQARRLGV